MSEPSATAILATRSTARITAAIVAVIGLAELSLWWLGAEPSRLSPAAVGSMLPLTAVCLTLAAVALVLLTASSRLALLPASAVLVIVLLTAAEYATGNDFGVDHLLFAASVATGRAGLSPYPGRLPGAATLGLLLIAAALTLAPYLDRRWARSGFLACATFGLLLSTATLLGYLFGAGSLEGVGLFARLALPSAVGLLLLFTGLLSLHAEHGWARPLLAAGHAGRQTRFLLAAVVLGPVLVAGLALLGSRAGLYDPDVRLALVTLVNVVMLTSAALWLAGRLAIEVSRLAELAATLDLTVTMVRDPDGTIRHWSGGCERLYGIAAAQAIGQRTHELLATEFPMPLSQIESALERDGVWAGELRHHAPNGKSFTVATQWALRRGRAQRPIAVVVANTDMTAQRAAEAAGRETAEQFRQIFEASPIGIVLNEARDSRIVAANPAFCAMLGYHAAELIGRARDELVHPEDRDIVPSLEQVPGEPLPPVERRYLTRSGSAITTRSRRTPLGLPRRSAPRLVLSIVEDMSQQRLIEAKLRQAHRMEAIGQLTGGLAHDFNNLLGVVIGNADFLLATLSEDPDRAELVTEILNSALNGAQLTRRLLAFARKQPLQPTTIDLNAFLPAHVALLQRILGSTIKVASVFDAELWPTLADASQIGDALLNLAINARDAMPGGGSLTIATTNATLDAQYADQNAEVSAGDYVVLSVTDTGGGMPLSVIERAFEPFFTTKGPGAGSGLGLSMIYGFAKQSRGHVKIDSAVGVGTTVRLYLPRVGIDDPVAPAIAIPSEMPGGSEAILLVDDNIDMRVVAARHLESLGYRLRLASNGPQALALLQAGERFDLLFTDVAMPGGMTGYQLAEAARQVQTDPKVLLTTGYAKLANGNGPPENDTLAMIAKPYRHQQLAVAVRTVLDGT